MKKYFLVGDKTTQEHLNKVFSEDNYYVSKYDILEDDSLLFIHLQSCKDDMSEILSNFSNTKVALLSDKPSFEEGYKLLGYNLKAYANTYMATMHYKQLVSMLKSNNNWFYPEFTTQLLNYAIESRCKDSSSDVNLEKLSKKEKEVVLCIGRGLKNSQIGERLKIKERTVKQHLSNIYAKLNIHDRVTLALIFK